jgi:hypothetical protein
MNTNTLNTNTLNTNTLDTNTLIESLALRAEPVSRLLAPWRRTALWLALSLLYVGVVAALHLAATPLPGPIGFSLVLEQAAILATAVTAAIAAFSSVVPGRDRRLALIPLIPLAIWLATLGQGCLSDWQAAGAAGLALRPDPDCVPVAVALGILPTVVMLTLLRRGAPLVPAVSMMLGALAVAAIANLGLRLSHVGDLSIQILVWHLLGAVVLSIAASRLGRYLLNWRALMARASDRYAVAS